MMSITETNIHHKLSIIIVTFNNEDHIHSCITSLRKSLSGMKIDHQIIVVDNNSNDSTAHLVRKEKVVTLLRQKINTGFARGVNIGIRQASGNLLLILNPDTRLQKSALINLYQCMRRSRSGIVGGLSYKRDKDIHGSFVRKPNLLTLLFDYSNLRKIFPKDIIHRRHYYQDKVLPKRQMSVDVVSGSYMMIDKNVIEVIGNFDENFFMYLEDVDFCVRALKKNIKISLCPKSKIFHEGGASSNNEDKILHDAWNKSRRYYAKKHFGTLSNMIVQPVFVADDLVTYIWRKLKSL